MMIHDEKSYDQRQNDEIVIGEIVIGEIITRFIDEHGRVPTGPEFDLEFAKITGEEPEPRELTYVMDEHGDHTS